MKAGRPPPPPSLARSGPATSPVPTPDLGRAVTAESALEAQQSFFEDIGHLFALQIKAYMDGCKEAGVEV